MSGPPDLNDQWKAGAVPDDPFCDDAGDSYAPASTPVTKGNGAAPALRSDWQAIIAASGLEALPDRPDLGAVAECLAKLADAAKGCDAKTREVTRARAVEVLKRRKVAGAAKLVDTHLQQPREAPAGQGSVPLLADPEPWPTPVAGAKLLAELSRNVTRHVKLPKGAAAAIALWVLHTHAIEAVRFSLRLAIVSPTKRCGKSTLLEWLESVVRRPLLAENVTAATVFRIIEASSPTLLIDEVDRFLAKSDELIGILNSGHKRGGVVLRCEGEDNAVRAFQVFGALAFGGIGRPRGADTLMDRSVVVRLIRKGAGESVEPLRRRQRAALAELQRKAWRWATDHLAALQDAEPETPPELNDRQADGWEGLLAIADAAGGPWHKLARDAAVLLSRGDDDDGSRGEQLLGDVRTYLADHAHVEHVTGDDLAKWLADLEGRPWAEMGRAAKPITATGVARLLKPFDIRPAKVRTGPSTARVYHRDAFADAFSRYLPPAQVEQPPQKGNHS